MKTDTVEEMSMDGVHIWPGNKVQYKRFVDEMQVAAMKEGGRSLQILKDIVPECNEANVAEFAEETARLIGMKNIRSAAELRKSTVFKSVAGQKQWLAEYNQRMYEKFFHATSGDAHDKVVEFGEEKVSKLMAEFKTSYGKAHEVIKTKLELIYESGITKPDGTEMLERDNLLDHFHSLEHQREELRNLTPKENLKTDWRIQDENMAKIIMRSVPAIYKPTIREVKSMYSLTAKINRISSRQTATTAAAPAGQGAVTRAGAAAAVPVAAQATVNPQTVADIIAEPEEVDFGAMIVPDLITLKEQLIEAWEEFKVAWEREDRGKRTTPTMWAGSAPDGSGSSTDATGHSCFNCGLPGHRHGDPACQRPGEMAFQPDWHREKFGDKRPSARRSAGAGAGGGGAASRGKGAGRGGGRARGGGGRGGYIKGAGPGDRACFKFRDFGYCKDGDACRYRHVAGPSQAPHGRSRSEQSLVDRTVSLAVKAIREELAAGQKRPAEGEDENPKSRKARKGDRTRSNAAMYSALAAHTCMAGNETGRAGQETPIQACLHDLDEVAWDTACGKSASTEIGDFPWLDRSEGAVRGRAMQGIGGLSSATAVGPMVVTLDQPRLGMMVTIVDPDGTYVEVTSPTQPRFRIIAAVRMKNMGMPMRFGTPTAAVCNRTGIEIPLVEREGILMLPTKRKDARNYKKNIALRREIENMRRGAASPLYINDRVIVSKVDAVQAFHAPVGLVGVRESLQEIVAYKKGEVVAFARESREVQNMQSQYRYPGRVFVCMVMNMRLLTAEQRARLMHWRFGHAHADVPVEMTRKKLVKGVEVLHRLVEDCAICDKAKFRQAPHPRMLPENRTEYPPYWLIYVDACGGQRSMGVKSYGGAVGNYIFVDVGSGDTQSLLYSTKDQFPALLERYLIGVLALQYIVRIIRLDGDAVNISADVERLANDYGFVLQPMSAGAPEENGFAEKAVGDVTRLARAFMLGAPHLKRNRWGAAYKYADKVNIVLPKKAKGGKTPYELIHHRVPDIDRMYIKVFGAPLQFRPLNQSPVKIEERTVDGWFLGLDAPSVLVERASDGKLMRISPKRVRVHEGMYCTHPYVSLDHLKYMVTLDDGDEHEIPSSVPSIKVLKPGALYDPVVNQGESEINTPLEFQEDNVEIDQRANIEQVKRMRDYLLDKQVSPDLQEEILTVLGKRAQSVTPHTGSTDKQWDQLGQKKKCDTIGRRATLRTRSAVQLPKVPQVPTQPNIDQTREPPSETDSGSDVLSCEVLRPPISRAPVGSRVMIESTRFDGDEPGSFSNEADFHTHGILVKRLKGGVVEVVWDGDPMPLRSHWTHIEYSDESELETERVRGPPQSKRQKVAKTMLASDRPGSVYENIARRLALPSWHEPLHTLALIERATIAQSESAEHDSMREVEEKDTDFPYPKTTWDALVRDTWRKWMTAIRKEHQGWVESNAFEIVDRDDMEEGSMCVDILEIFSKKRTGIEKFRACLRGDQLRKDIDYKTTFSATVTADSIRIFFSLATQLGKQVHGGDVRCAYLQSKQRIPIYAFLPSYIDLVDLSWEELGEIRKGLLSILEQGGPRAIREYVRTKRRGSRRVLRLLSSVYGTPDAGNAWGLLLISILTERMGFRRSCVDGCLYFKTNSVYEEKTNTRDAQWVTEYIIVLTWTDDMPYFGTPSMVEWYESEIQKHVPMEFTPVCTDFIGIEVHQDLVKGVTTLTQAKYWVAAGERFKEYLTFPNRVRIPLPEGTVMVPATPQEHEAAKHLPYRELVGTLAFPSCHTKIVEIRYAVSQLSAYMQRWNEVHWNYALQCLKYCINTRDIGLMMSKDLDEHGINVLYAYCDSAFTAPRSQGCRLTMINGCTVSLSSQKHSTVDVSTTGAELTEAYLASNDVVGFRNLMQELGFRLQGPTTMYEDNQPAIAVAEGNRNLASKTKHMDIRVWKLRERIDDHEIVLQFCSTHDMLADIGTKALGVCTFEYLRDLCNGYAIVRLRYKDYKMPLLCVSWSDLSAIMCSQEQARRHSQNGE